MAGRTILIVEDEFLIRLTLAEALADEGFEILEASTAAEALALLRHSTDVALLLTDVQLPGGMDGVQLASAARLSAPHLPVIYMTGRPESASRATTSARDAFIAKPYLPSVVCAAARRLISA
jgi:CheY-like chemotaxis protein